MNGKKSNFCQKVNVNFVMVNKVTKQNTDALIALNTSTTINMKKNKAHRQQEANIHSSAHS